MKKYNAQERKTYLYFWTFLLLGEIFISFLIHLFLLFETDGLLLLLIQFFGDLTIRLDWILVIPLVCLFSFFTIRLTVDQIKHKNLLLGEKIFIFSVLVFALVLLVFKVIWWGNALSVF